MADLLVVTNDPAFGIALREELSVAGHRARIAADGIEASALLDQGLRPALIVLDGSAFASWAPFTRDALHCRPNCPPLLIEHRETLAQPEGWQRFLDLVRCAASRSDQRSARTSS
jgi:DNA-binding NtrC family response regulator